MPIMDITDIAMARMHKRTHTQTHTHTKTAFPGVALAVLELAL